MESGGSSGENHMENSAFSGVHRLREVDSQVIEAFTEVQLDTANHCQYDLYTNSINLCTVPGAAVPSTAAVGGLSYDYMSQGWPSPATSCVSGSSSSLSSTSTRSSATVACRGPSFWNVQSVTAHDRASRPRPVSEPYRQTTVQRVLRHSDPPTKHAVPTTNINGQSQGDVDSLTQSRQDGVAVRCFCPAFDENSLRSRCWDHEVLTKFRVDGAAGRRLDQAIHVASGISRQPGALGTVQSNNGDCKTADQLTKLERRLAERDTELRTLRETMERNELAMLRVIDDRKRAWERELNQRRAEWQRSIHDHRDRCERTEHLLKASVARLQSENASLRAGEERELELELKTARASVDRLKAELELKRAEIGALHATIDTYQTSAAHCACAVKPEVVNTVTSLDDDTTRTAVTQPPASWKRVSTDTQAKEVILSLIHI